MLLIQASTAALILAVLTGSRGCIIGSLLLIGGAIYVTH